MRIPSPPTVQNTVIRVLLGASLAVLLMATASMVSADHVPLPAGATRLDEVGGDVDGDGSVDSVALYVQGGDRPGSATFGVIVARAGRPSVDLFAPAEGTSPSPSAANASLRLQLDDFSGDGRPEIAVLAAYAGSGGMAPEEGLWVFAWDGTRFREEIQLRGQTARFLAPDGRGTVSLAHFTEEQIHTTAGDQPVRTAIQSSYQWRGDGLRLASRQLALLSDGIEPLSPELAVLLHYHRIARGDLRGAYDLLSASAKASQSFESFAAGFATTEAVRVEEAHAQPSRPDSASVPVVIRLTAVDRGASGPVEQSFAGTWNTIQRGQRWELDRARIAPGPSSARIADALPGGSNIASTAQGDLRQIGRNDIVAVRALPGGFMQDLYLLQEEGGLFTGRPLADLVGNANLGDFAHDVQIEDVNGDGRSELVVNSIAGAHGSALAIFHADGSGLRTLFEGWSNTPALSLDDLNDDGVAEIFYPLSGYCGSYAESPGFTFILAWSASRYVPATADFLDVNTAKEHLYGDDGGLSRRSPGEEIAARGCIQHMNALGYAVHGRAAEARLAFRAYVDALEASATDPAPSYLGDLFDAEVSDLIQRAGRGALGSFGPRETALLHDLLADSHDANARALLSLAEWADEDGRTSDAASYRAEAATSTALALAEYQRALALDPGDTEAQRGLTRIQRR